MRTAGVEYVRWAFTGNNQRAAVFQLDGRLSSTHSHQFCRERHPIESDRGFCPTPIRNTDPVLRSDISGPILHPLSITISAPKRHTHPMAKKKTSSTKAKAKAEKKARTVQKVEKKEKKKAGKSKLADEEDDNQDLEGILDQVNSLLPSFFLG